MRSLSRRAVLKRAALAAGSAVVVPLVVPPSILGKYAPSNRLNLAVIGLGGQGGVNLRAGKDQNIVALCDVDDKRAGTAYDRFPKAQKFTDFRKLFDAVENHIDGAVISTPDHSHFHPAYWAMQRGKHVYLEKPLAHNVWEIRTLTKLAAEKKIATQLGAQRHTLEGLRRGVEIVKAGTLGTITEVHSWMGGGRGMPDIPTQKEEIPATLDWDLWLGPAEDRPYSKAYVPYNWRFWWDFGTGDAGNWGCHILDIPYWALGLKYPTKVEASGPAPDKQRTPKSLSARFEFPATHQRPAVVVHWHQGTPQAAKELGVKLDSFNNLFIGADGKLLCGFGKQYMLLPEKKFAGFQLPASTIPKSPGFHNEWFQACQGGAPATCNFDYSGPMAESVILANVAYRVQGGFEWDAATLTPKGNPAAQQYIREPFRKGWQI